MERCKIGGMVENCSNIQFFVVFYSCREKWIYMPEICNWTCSDIVGEGTENIDFK